MDTAKFDVVCLGILVADVVVSGVGGLPEPGAISAVPGMSLNLGGCAANTATCLARLGFKVAVAGMVGDDPLGHFILDSLSAENVSVEGVRISKDIPTGAAVACVYPGGERGFWSLLGCNGALKDGDVDAGLASSGRILHVAGTPYLKGFNGEPCARLMRQARAKGVMTSLDTIHYGAGFRALVEPEMRECDLLLPSYDEAKSLAGVAEPHFIAENLLGYGAKAVAVKMGAAGAYVSDGIRHGMISGVKVEVADTVGAGDAFVAGFLAGWLKGRSIQECAQWGNVLGAQCVSATGSTTGVRGMEALLAQSRANYQLSANMKGRGNARR